MVGKGDIGLFFIACRCAGRGGIAFCRGIVFRRCFVSTGTVIGRIKPRAFKNKPGPGAQQTFHLPFAPVFLLAAFFGTGSERLIFHGLEDLESFGAFLAMVFVSGHGFGETLTNSRICALINAVCILSGDGS